MISLLKEFTHNQKNELEIILVGGLALAYYGMENRATVDIDAEIEGDVSGLFNFLKSRNIPADIGENISGWSVIAMPPGYRERALTIDKDELLTVKVLSPVDFIIAKLRRFTEEDLADALFVAKRFDIKPADVQKAAESAIKGSPKDTALFVFRRNVGLFIEEMKTMRTQQN
ncbi:MAG: hypothetical protein HY776_04110 [Actinobacteria bacterium]|nr:hypothetical protein [Actinomycetota bacterium]